MDHLVSFLSKVVESMVLDPTILPPEENAREAQTFDLNRCLGALACPYPDHCSGVFTEWRDQVEHVNGDATSHITPKNRFQGKHSQISGARTRPKSC